MISREFEKRTYDCFLSYGTEDVALARQIHAFLSHCGLKVFFDEQRLASGQPVVEELSRAMADSKACLVLLRPATIKKAYVRHEVACANRQAVEHAGAFRFVAALLEEFQPSAEFESLGNLSWLKLVDGVLSVVEARNTLLALRRSESLARQGQPQIYVSCSWRDQETHPRDFILRRYAGRGGFLVGDCRDQSHFEEGGIARIRRIISSCSGFLAIYPHRDDPAKSPEEHYKYFTDELELAREIGLPIRGYCVDPSVLPASLAGPWTALPADGAVKDIDGDIDELLDDARGNSPHAFLATDFKRSQHRNEAARDIVEHLMGMSCTLGKEVSGGGLRQKLIDAIRRSNIVIADIACALEESGRLAVNINTCVEAGIAMASDRPLFVTSIDPTIGNGQAKRTEAIPFFFRDHAIQWYADDLGFLATIHRIARDRRRRVINDELDLVGKPTAPV